MISKLKQFLSKTDASTKSAWVVFYPNQVIVTTYDFTTTGLGLASSKLTKLPMDVAPEILGATLRKHFDLTKYNLQHPQTSEAFKKINKDHQAMAGFKSNKESYTDAKVISCSMSKDSITLYPCENRFRSGYYPIADSEIILKTSVSDQELGKELLLARATSRG